MYLKQLNKKPFQILKLKLYYLNMFIIFTYTFFIFQECIRLFQGRYILMPVFDFLAPSLQQSAGNNKPIMITDLIYD